MGLAQQSAGQGRQQMLMQVVDALASGMSPEELIQQGVPEDVIMAAMQILEQQQGAEQIPTEQAGLAGMVTPNTLQGM